MNRSLHLNFGIHILQNKIYKAESFRNLKMYVETKG